MKLKIIIPTGNIVLDSSKEWRSWRTWIRQTQLMTTLKCWRVLWPRNVFWMVMAALRITKNRSLRISAFAHEVSILAASCSWGLHPHVRASRSTTAHPPTRCSGRRMFSFLFTSCLPKWPWMTQAVASVACREITCSVILVLFILLCKQPRQIDWILTIASNSSWFNLVWKYPPYESWVVTGAYCRFCSCFLWSWR